MTPPVSGRSAITAPRAEFQVRSSSGSCAVSECRAAAFQIATTTAAAFVAAITATFALFGAALQELWAAVHFRSRGSLQTGAGRGRQGTAATSGSPLLVAGGVRGRTGFWSLIGSAVLAIPAPLRFRQAQLSGAARGVLDIRCNRPRRAGVALIGVGLFAGHLLHRLRAVRAALHGQAALAEIAPHRGRVLSIWGQAEGMISAAPIFRLRGPYHNLHGEGLLVATVGVRSSGPLLRASATTFLRVDGSARRLRTRYAV